MDHGKGVRKNGRKAEGREEKEKGRGMTGEDGEGFHSAFFSL